MTLRPTQAVILAGGQGTRLRPYTDDRPKPMVEIPGTGLPIIGHQISWLAAEGVTDVVVSCGHLAEVLREWLSTADLPAPRASANGPAGGPAGAADHPAGAGETSAGETSAGEDGTGPVRVEVVVEQQPLGRGGGLKYAAASLPRPGEPWYATNGDIWTRFPLREMAAFHAERDAVATLALARPRIPWGAVETDSFGHVLDFVEAPPSPYLVNAGVYVFSASFAGMLPERGDHERTTFPGLARRRLLAGFPLPQGAYWRAIDTVKDLTEAARELAEVTDGRR